MAKATAKQKGKVEKVMLLIDDIDFVTFQRWRPK